MLVGTAWWMIGEYYAERRVWMLDEPPSVVRDAAAEEGDHIIVVGMRANSPDVVIGRPCVDQLRAAGIA